MRRGVLIICLVSISVVGMVGCSPRRNGVTGITVDADGHLVATLAWCDDDPPDGVTLYYNARGGNREVARFRAPELTARTASFRMDEPDGGWTAELPMPPLDRDIQYWMYGWTDHSTASTSQVRLHGNDLDRLSVGTVLVREGELVSQAEFERVAGKSCSA